MLKFGNVAYNLKKGLFVCWGFFSQKVANIEFHLFSRLQSTKFYVSESSVFDKVMLNIVKVAVRLENIRWSRRYFMKCTICVSKVTSFLTSCEDNSGVLLVKGLQVVTWLLLYSLYNVFYNVSHHIGIERGYYIVPNKLSIASIHSLWEIGTIS